jgi:hypothetical protein
LPIKILNISNWPSLSLVTWGLEVIEESYRFPFVLKNIKEVLSLSTLQLQEVKKKLPGIIFTGDRKQVQDVKETLERRGINVFMRQINETDKY